MWHWWEDPLYFRATKDRAFAKGAEEAAIRAARAVGLKILPDAPKVLTLANLGL